MLSIKTSIPTLQPAGKHSTFYFKFMSSENPKKINLLTEMWNLRKAFALFHPHIKCVLRLGC